MSRYKKISNELLNADFLICLTDLEASFEYLNRHLRKTSPYNQRQRETNVENCCFFCNFW